MNCAARLLVVVSLAAPSLALAQVAPSVEFQRREFGPRLAPRAEPRAAAPSAEARPAPAEDAAQSFLLNAVVLDGATALTEAQLADIWAPMIGAQATVATLEEIAAAISARYRAQGFVLSQAAVPAQTIENGVVRIQVVEGFVDTVSVEGGAVSSQATARRLLAPVASDRPLRLETLERGVLLTRDALGGDVETVLKPSPSTFGAADLTAVLGDKQIDGFLAVDNKASRLYGGWIATGGVTTYDLVGFGERIDLLGAVAPNNDYLAFGQARISVPAPFLDGGALDGARFELGGDFSRGEPDLDKSGVPGFTEVSEETNVTVGMVVPFIRTRAENLSGRIGLGWRESTSDTRFGGAPVDSGRDELVIGEARLTWDRADRFGGVNLVDLGVRQGFDAAGATVAGSGPAAGEIDFTLGQLTLIRLQRLGDSPWSIYAEATGQMAATILPDSERFALGGEGLGRGFAPGNTTGDSGYGGRLEVRVDVAGADTDNLVSALQLYGFGDWGQAYDRSDARDGAQWETLGSIGGGVRIDVTPWLTVTPEVAFQVAGAPADRIDQDRETRFFISAVGRF